MILNIPKYSLKYTYIANLSKLLDNNFIQIVKKILFQDVQHKMKDHFRGVLDEFNSNEKASEAEVLLKHLIYELFYVCV